MVVVGLPPRVYEHERQQWMRWADPREHASYLANCAHCEGWFWMRPTESFRCRRCGVLDRDAVDHLHSGSAGEMVFFRSDRHEWTEVG
jgi:hypothetical protein